MKENKELQKIENIMEIETPIDPKSKEFEKVMFIYQVALKEINTKLEILKDEFKLFYEYDLIDHINTRIKSPESITQKMKDKNLKYTYKEMIKNIKSYDQELYFTRVNRYFERYPLYDDGNASRRVVDWLEKKIKEKK